MNYFVTHCDINFLEYAERLFETLLLFSDNKIIFYTIDFKYDSKFENVIPIEFDSKTHIQSLNNYKLFCSDSDAIKAYHVFLKPVIIKKLLCEKKYENDNFCYLDSDCLAINNCDRIFEKTIDISDYPLLNKCCYDFLIMDAKGDPFTENGFDLNKTLEADLMKFLNIDLNLRSGKPYLQTGVFLFNKKCVDFFDVWYDTCFLEDIIKNWKKWTPFHEETVINCLLWKKDFYKHLDQSLINLPYNNINYDVSMFKIKKMISALDDATENGYFLDNFCFIPSKLNLENLFFYHGKVSSSEYTYIKKHIMNNYLIKINSQSLGDTLAATPTLRKLYFSYGKKIDVMTHHPDLFYKNQYINRIFTFKEKINEKGYKEIFNTFLGVGGEKNKFGVEKKHNTIDIRQYHALDLGFMLNESEMEYDYIPNEYIKIPELPSDYICLHVANTWPSRTYSDLDWQKLIEMINNHNIPIVLIGKNSYESGFFNVDKPTKKLNFKIGLDLTNKLDISQCWHVINMSKYFITMDSGLLHLAGTTDTNIIQLGSSINYKLRAPFRKNSQSYKYKYISGSCNLFCASDIKYGVKEWKTIQGVPPLINCLENKNSFECHPTPYQIYNILFNNINNVSPDNRKKFLFITPHLSTGGSPKYLQWLIDQKIKEGYFVKVLEWNLYSPTYTIQRDAIIKMVDIKNFYSVGSYEEEDSIFYGKIKDVIDFVKNFSPDYIHLNEYTENFAIKQLPNDFIKFIYNNDRKYKIYETTHSANTDVLHKINIPDELWFVSPYQYEKAKNLNIKTSLVEMEITKKNRPNRNQTLKNLGLDPQKLHILQVGLFSKNKNQKFIFDIAKNFINKNIEFHFIGNSCYVDECNINKDQLNCKIWGERSDVDLFMSCMDVFVMPSYEELNPIALKEAISWDMKCFVSDLVTIHDIYKDNENVTFIHGNNFIDYIAQTSKQFNTKNYNIHDEYDVNEIKITYFPKPKVEIIGDIKCEYNIKFIDRMTDKVHYQSKINNNMWTICAIEYYCDWKIIIQNLTTHFEKTYIFSLKDKSVKIINESPSLGDCIAWIPAIDEFQKKHKCKIDFYTIKKDLFTSEYPNINFLNYSDFLDTQYYAQYKIGCFEKSENSNLIKNDWKKLNLQEIAFDALGLNFIETRTKIKIPNNYKFSNNKYVCIATQSTSQSRYWNNPEGWKSVIDYLKSKNYKTVCVDRYFSFGNNEYRNTCPVNIDYFAGNHSFEDIIDLINGSEFFIGLSSGLSWLAWALNKKIIKINSSVDSSFEFSTPYIVQNLNVCHNCFNNELHKFDASKWDWCPENKNFECSKNISVESVIKNIDDLILKSNIKI